MIKNTIITSVILLSVIVGIKIFFLDTTKEMSVNSKQQIKESKKLGIVDQIALQVNKMSLDQKIGQMLIVGFENNYLDDHIQKMIKEYHIGGINLFRRNVKDRNQIQQLTARLQKISTIPLFIATDQEGGDVIRFNFLEELTPQIKIKDAEQARQIAFSRATELREIGINMNFSPVLDYVSNNKSYLYNRTFGVDPGNIGNLGNAMIKGYIGGKVVPVAKHFPGYGNLLRDPHTNQAKLTINEKELQINLIPFQKVIATNSSNIAIMTAHIVVPNIDTKPATLSSTFITEILRKQFGFNGVIITDDMEMVSAGNLTSQSSLNAIIAGADMIISTYTPQKQIEIFDRIKKAVLEKEISEKRIDESIMRILTLKSTLSKVTP